MVLKKTHKSINQRTTWYLYGLICIKQSPEFETLYVKTKDPCYMRKGTLASLSLIPFGHACAALKRSYILSSLSEASFRSIYYLRELRWLMLSILATFKYLYHTKHGHFPTVPYTPIEEL